MKKYGWVFFCALFVFMLIMMFHATNADAAVGKPFVVNATAYCNPNGNLTFSGKPTVEGRTLAGKEEWIGCVAALYEMNDDGSIGKFIGYREFEGTGYGVDSELFPGMGTIESGETVDIYWGEDRDGALEWGIRKIWIQIIDGKG